MSRGRPAMTHLQAYCCASRGPRRRRAFNALLNHNFPYEKFSFLACPVFQTLQSLAKDVYIDKCWTAATTRASVQLGLLCQTRVRRSGVSSEARVPTVTLYLRVSVFFPQNIKVHPIATGWWFGTWLLFFIFFPSYWGHVIIPTDELTPSFFRGVGQPATWRCDEDDEDPALAPRLSKIKNRNTIYCSFKQHQMIWCSRYISLIHPIPKPFHPSFLGGCYMFHMFLLAFSIDFHELSIYFQDFHRFSRGFRVRQTVPLMPWPARLWHRSWPPEATRPRCNWLQGSLVMRWRNWGNSTGSGLGFFHRMTAWGIA